ncbi:hypothetical protein D9M73_78710 [compost metagenome]
MTTKPASQLRLSIVKVGFTPDELASLDTRRGHYGRAAFLRAAGLDIKLMAAPSAAAVTTWAESARVQACFTQINDIAFSLNNTRQAAGVDSAAAELLSRSAEILSAFKTFRAEILGGHPAGEV